MVSFRNVYILPGVPSLFRAKLAALRDRFRAAPFVTGRLHLAVDETQVAARLAAVAAAHPAVAFGSYPRFDDAEYQLIITAEGKNAGEVRRAIDALATALGDLVHRVEPPM